VIEAIICKLAGHKWRGPRQWEIHEEIMSGRRDLVIGKCQRCGEEVRLRCFNHVQKEKAKSTQR
jgi:hypothetical protein